MPKSKYTEQSGFYDAFSSILKEFEILQKETYRDYGDQEAATSAIIEFIEETAYEIMDNDEEIDTALIGNFVKHLKYTMEEIDHQALESEDKEDKEDVSYDDEDIDLDD